MGSDLSLADLKRLANELCRKYWGVDYTGELELVNRNWSCRAACFVHDHTDKSIQIIRMSSKRNATFTQEEIRGWLLHELVHWRLWSEDKPFRDTDREFINECLRVGACISKERRAQEAFKRHQAGAKWLTKEEYYRSLENRCCL